MRRNATHVGPCHEPFDLDRTALTCAPLGGADGMGAKTAMACLSANTLVFSKVATRHAHAMHTIHVCHAIEYVPDSVLEYTGTMRPVHAIVHGIPGGDHCTPFRIPTLIQVEGMRSVALLSTTLSRTYGSHELKVSLVSVASILH